MSDLTLTKRKILVTGAFGFIGSNMVAFLNRQDIVPYVYDWWAEGDPKWRNMTGLCYNLIDGKTDVSGFTVIHLGARVDTTEPMSEILWEHNVRQTIELRKRCGRFIYASSAAVYGAEDGDFTERIAGLKPLNPYGATKHYLDNHFFGSQSIPYNEYGLRFFNVYGPREQHKGRMASVIHKALTKRYPIWDDTRVTKLDGATERINNYPHWTLFKSHRDGIEHGEQKRDFVYVEDVCRVIWHFIGTTPTAGVYNVGSGQARSFKDIVTAVDPKLPIEYVDMPADIRGQYQYFTQADLTKLRAAGYTAPMTTLEEGIEKTRAYLAENPA